MIETLWLREVDEARLIDRRSHQFPRAFACGSAGDPWRFARASQARKSSIPAVIDAKNHTASRTPTPAAAMAGPGQKP